jgi:HEAT repeat protein
MAEQDTRSVAELFAAATNWNCDECGASCEEESGENCEHGCGDSTAVTALHWLGSREVLDEALKLTTSADPRVRARAADILGQLGVPERTFPEECLRATINLLSNDTDPRVLQAAAVALGHLPQEPRGTSALVKLVAHDDPDIRFGVAFALCGRTDPESIAALIRLTKDDEDEVRDWATFGLGSQCDIDTEPVRGALLDRVTDEHFDTRSEALVGLARRGDDRVIASVLAALRAEVVGEMAMEAAGLLGREDFLEALRDLRSWWDVNEELLERSIQQCEGQEDQQSEERSGRE